MPNAPTKVVGRRLVGFLIDSILFSLFAGVLFALLAEKKDTSGTVDDNGAVTSMHFTSEDSLQLNGVPFVVWLVLVLGFLVGVAVVLEGRTGWTPGKLMLGVRVVDAEGQPPGMGRAAIRLLGWLVDGLPWIFLWGLCGLITSATSQGNRRVGDMMGGTYVVQKDAVGQPVVVGGVAVPGPDPAFPAVPRVSQPFGAVAASGPIVGRDAFGNPLRPPVYPGSPPAVAPSSSSEPVAPVTPPAPAPAPPASSLPAADWCPDPAGKKRLRYWDGSAWTEHTAD